jgi:hypothetical protein
MLIRDIINETTSAGGIATVAQPMGKMIKRPNPSIYGKKKKTTEDQVPYLQRPNTGYAKAIADYLRLNPGKTEEDFKLLTPKKQEKYLDKYLEGKKQKIRVAESNPRREAAVKVLVDKIKAKGLDQFREYQGNIDRDAIESYMARNMPDSYRGRDTGKAIEDAMAELESSFVEGKSPHKKGTKKYKKHMAAMHAG